MVEERVVQGGTTANSQVWADLQENIWRRAAE